MCIRDRASYEELSLNYPSSKEWLFEEFISESYGRDLRFYLSLIHILHDAGDSQIQITGLLRDDLTGTPV